MSTTYQWRDSYRKFYPIDPEQAGQALAEIESQDGQLTAQSVVDAARPKRAPLHDAFEWDNTVAADEWRREQARSIIKSIQIVVVEEEGEEQPEVRPIYFNVQMDTGTAGYYKSREVLSQSIEEWESALQLAKQQLAGSLKSLQAIEDLRPSLSKQQTRTLARARKSIEAAQGDLALV